MMNTPITIPIVATTVALATIAAGILSVRARATNALIVEPQAMSEPTQPAPLQLEGKIPLGHVSGRIDHMAIDLKRQRLFIAELGNNSVGVVDLFKRTIIQNIAGLREPQGVAYVPSTDVLYVANAGDGSIRFFRGSDYSPVGRIDLGEDADNIRVDATANRVLVGYGSGALAIIDPASQRKIGDVPLKAHPESFQLDTRTSHVFVNLPDAHSIAIIDRTARHQIASWPTSGLGANFPMALHEAHRHVLVAFRRPSRLGVYSMRDGSLIATTHICGDADDIFVDEKRQRAYVSCGHGFIDVLDTQNPAYPRVAHIPTASGAPTSLFIPALDLLVLAVRARAERQAAIWVFRPTP
jgi:DNA-binding beta-propeller fold protein YncE